MMKIIDTSNVNVLPNQQSIAEEVREVCDNLEDKFENKITA